MLIHHPCLPLEIAEEPCHPVGLRNVCEIVEGVSDFVHANIEDYSATLLWRRWDDDDYSCVGIQCREEPLMVRVCLPQTAHGTGREAICVNGERLKLQGILERVSRQPTEGSMQGPAGFDVASLSMRRLVWGLGVYARSEVSMVGTSVHVYPNATLQKIPITHYKLMHHSPSDMWPRGRSLLPASAPALSLLPRCRVMELSLHRESCVPVYFRATSMDDTARALVEFALLDLQLNTGLSQPFQPSVAAGRWTPV